MIWTLLYIARSRKEIEERERDKSANYLFSMVFHMKNYAVTGLQIKFIILLRKRKMQTKYSIWWQKKWRNMANQKIKIKNKYGKD